MNRWRVIFAAFVIFAAGAATGAMALRAYAPKAAQKSVSSPLPVSPDRRQDYLSRLDKELQLTPEQHSKVEAILAASQERMKDIWKSMEPRTKEEYARTRKEISEILTPEQREKKRQMRHNREHGGDNKPANAPADATNSGNSGRKPEACLRARCKAC